MKNKKIKSTNTSSNFPKSAKSSSSFISDEEFTIDKKYDFLSKAESSAYSKKTKSRQSNSLDELTKKFMRYVMEAKNSSINLNSVMKKIKVKKRRIYDITNVLEGKSFI
jgi:hypothetical protein